MEVLGGGLDHVFFFSWRLQSLYNFCVYMGLFLKSLLSTGRCSYVGPDSW